MYVRMRTCWAAADSHEWEPARESHIITRLGGIPSAAQAGGGEEAYETSEGQPGWLAGWLGDNPNSLPHISVQSVKLSWLATQASRQCRHAAAAATRNGET